MTTPVLAARNVDKSFGAVVALKGAGIALQAGRVNAIVGENGAGKSTLAKILAGILHPDHGQIEVNGEPAAFRRRTDAIAAGIGYVPQALSFINTLTLAENHLLAAPGFYADRHAARDRLAAAAEELDVDVPFDVPLERLSLPERQLGEIISAVADGARVLLLDEPTSALGPIEIEKLIASVRRLADSGTAIGLVTHRIAEVLRGADTVTVLRNGVPLFDGSTAGINADEIARLMVGGAPALVSPPAAHGGGPVRLHVSGMSVENDGIRFLDDIGFSVRSGEVVGLAGVAGPGQTMLSEVLAGLRKPTRGAVHVDRTDTTGDAAGARAKGLAHIPDERAQGIVGDLSVAENASFFHVGEDAFTEFGLRRRSAEIAFAGSITARNNVNPPDPYLPAGALSGGNQQKLLVGRELDGTPSVIVAHGPTQGLDVAAAANIRERLLAAASAGAAVLVISADLDEILNISHRILVLAGGRIVDDIELGSGPPDMVRIGLAIGASTRNSTAAKVESHMNAPVRSETLPPLLGRAFPPAGLKPHEEKALTALQVILDTEIAPRAAETDAVGRYPVESIAALKRSGILATAIPVELGGLGFSHRASIEAQLRIAAADSAVGQIFKIHEECLREIILNIPDEHRAALVDAVVRERKIIGLAVAEAGKKVDDPMTTIFAPKAGGGGTINGQKIYTTGAAGADLIAVWSFDPTAEGIDKIPVLGLREYLVPAATPGITIHRDWDALGQRATDSGTITFTNLEVRAEWNVLAPGKFPPVYGPLLWQLGFAANLIGNGIGAIRAAIPFINERSRPWPSAGTDNAADDPYVRRLAGELTADLAAAYALTLAAADLLDAIARGEIDRTTLAIPIYAAKSAASRAAVRATSEIFSLMGTRSANRANGFDRYWRNARIISLHDPVDWKNGEIGHHILRNWEPPWGIYQ